MQVRGIPIFPPLRVQSFAEWLVYLRECKATERVVGPLILKHFLNLFPVSESTGSVYKFRADCQMDAALFLWKLRASVLSAEYLDGTPDIEVSFSSEMSFHDLLSISRFVDDGHVITQTLKPISDYTGERNYNL